MLFNSPQYFIFLVLVLLAFWNIKNIPFRNIFLLLVSYLFYGFWDYRFLSLIVFSSFCDFHLGKLMATIENPTKRKRLLLLSLGLNLGLLAYFKYCNFFIDSAVAALAYLGIKSGMNTLNIILPVGISFYTFQTLSYTIDVYRKKISPTKDWVAFFAFVSFFPQLVAGPIERASALLPQFQQPSKFREADFIQGLRQIIWGLFKKNCYCWPVRPISKWHFRATGGILLRHSFIRRHSIFLPDLRWFFWLLGHSYWLSKTPWFPATAKLCLSLLLAGHCRILATLAHFPFNLVQGLSLHPTWRQ